jgi:hypothetical protein
MADEQQHKAADRIRVELVEADVDSGFGLVDLALEEYHSGNLAFAQRALHDADDVLTDIERRLRQLDVEHSRPFGPLVEELRKAVQAAHEECHA